MWMLPSGHSSAPIRMTTGSTSTLLPLNAAEQEVLLCKMEAFCQQQTGMSLHEYARQLRDSETQAPEMQM